LGGRRERQAPSRAATKGAKPPSSRASGAAPEWVVSMDSPLALVSAAPLPLSIFHVCPDAQCRALVTGGARFPAPTPTRDGAGPAAGGRERDPGAGGIVTRTKAVARPDRMPQNRPSHWFRAGEAVRVVRDSAGSGCGRHAVPREHVGGVGRFRDGGDRLPGQVRRTGSRPTPGREASVLPRRRR
jgi:hypothetical protein